MIYIYIAQSLLLNLRLIQIINIKQQHKSLISFFPRTLPFNSYINQQVINHQLDPDIHSNPPKKSQKKMSQQNQQQSQMQQSHEPQLLRQLRQKSLSLTFQIQKLTKQNKHKQQYRNTLQQQVTKLNQQKQIQNKKYRSLIVLLNQLQQNYNQQYVQMSKEKSIDQVGLSLQNGLIRFILIQRTQAVKQAQKLVNFLKTILLDRNPKNSTTNSNFTISRNTPNPRQQQISATSTKQYIKKSNFLEQQSQTIAKLKSQIQLLNNHSLQCKRKWYQLQQQSKNTQSYNKLLSIQNQRQKVQLKLMYEEYLQRINDMKGKIVQYNQTQKQSIISEYLVKQIAILQQKRVQIQSQAANLQFHYESLVQELNRIQIQNRQLKSFFASGGGQPNGNSSQNMANTQLNLSSGTKQSLLAQKMKKRIQQLRDVLLQLKKKNKSTRNIKLRKILQNIRNNHKILQQNNDYIELKTKQQEHYGSFLQQKTVSDFFNKILQQKDKVINLMYEEQNMLKDKIKDMCVQKELLENQIGNIQENLDIGAPVGAVSVGFNRGVGGSDAGGVFGDVGKISGLGVGLDISNKYVYRGSNPNQPKTTPPNTNNNGYNFTFDTRKP